MKRKFLIFNFQFLILALAMSSCKSHQSASRSQTRMTSSSQVSVLNKSLKADTASTYTVTHTNGYIFIKETQTITEYDTTQPTNPVSKKTETKKNTIKETQKSTQELCHSERSEESEDIHNGTHNSELTTQHSEDRSSTPVVQTTAKWYITGGIVVAILTVISTWLARRNRKRKTPPCEGG